MRNAQRLGGTGEGGRQRYLPLAFQDFKQILIRNLELQYQLSELISHLESLSTKLGSMPGSHRTFRPERD